MIAGGGLFLNGCSKEDLVGDQPIQKEDASLLTRASGFHWQCTYQDCRFSLNGGWRNYCSACGKEYNASHGRLVLSFSDAISRTVGFDSGGGLMNDDNVGNRIELPKKLFLSYGPGSWFETSASLKYYENLKTLFYHSDSAYAEGVDFGWYRTIRVLYPKISNLTTIERLYDQFIINEGRYLTGSNGKGIKDGSKAAIDAFKAYK